MFDNDAASSSCYSAARQAALPLRAGAQVFAVHQHDEFNLIVVRRACRSTVPPVCKFGHCSGPWEAV